MYADEAEVALRFRRFLESFSDGGVRRCGIGRAAGADGTRAIAAVVVDALADLRPVPVRTRVGGWIRLEAELLVPATSAKLVALGPRGAPRTVLTSLSNGRAVTTLSLDQDGPWLLQLVATVDSGPRPVLEALVFAGVEPPPEFTALPAPGEDAGTGAADEPTALARMANAARASESLGPLARQPELDRLAAEHAEAMQRTGRLAHDAGDGSPPARLARAGIDVRSAGENVAHAATIAHAHRALWASPSHRATLLDARFDHFGIGIAHDADGTIWVAEMFADFGGTGIGPPAHPSQNPP